MKFFKFIFIFSFLTLNNCSVGNENTTYQEVIEIYWNLVNVSGGVAGIDDNFETGTITWTFDEINETLTVVNNNADNTKEDGLESGTYSFSITAVGDGLFLQIDGNEIGRFTFLPNRLIINENETSQGSGADGFIYTFSKTTVTE